MMYLFKIMNKQHKKNIFFLCSLYIIYKVNVILLRKISCELVGTTNFEKIKKFY